MALPWILIQYGTDGAIPTEPATNFGPPPWGLLTYGTDGDAPPEPPVVEVRQPSGGSGGYTYKEILRLDKRRKKIDAELTETLRQLAYGKTPELEAKAAALQAIIRDEDDEMAVITMLMQYYRKRKTLH